MANLIGVADTTSSPVARLFLEMVQHHTLASKEDMKDIKDEVRVFKMSV